MASGVTFAPEAGSQRMRDVVNKNVTEEQLMTTAERVFARGWGKRDWIEHDPDYDSLRDDPRFQAMLEKLK